MIRVRTPRWSVEICSSNWASLINKDHIVHWSEASFWTFVHIIGPAQAFSAGHCLITASFFLQPDNILISFSFIPLFLHLSLFLLSKSTTQLMIPANRRKPPETKKLILYWFVPSKIQPGMRIQLCWSNWTGSPLIGGPIMLEKPLKSVRRPNAEVRLSSLFWKWNLNNWNQSSKENMISPITYSHSNLFLHFSSHFHPQ